MTNAYKLGPPMTHWLQVTTKIREIPENTIKTPPLAENVAVSLDEISKETDEGFTFSCVHFRHADTVVLPTFAESHPLTKLMRAMTWLGSGTRFSSFSTSLLFCPPAEKFLLLCRVAGSDAQANRRLTGRTTRNPLRELEDTLSSSHHSKSH